MLAGNAAAPTPEKLGTRANHAQRATPSFCNSREQAEQTEEGPSPSVCHSIPVSKAGTPLSLQAVIDMFFFFQAGQQQGKSWEYKCRLCATPTDMPC